MATFQVPQFIDEQPKVVGFLTLPQFLYLALSGDAVPGWESMDWHDLAITLVMREKHGKAWDEKGWIAR